MAVHPILVCCDGSADAKSALVEVPRLFPGSAATVFAIWEPYVEVLAHTGLGPGYLAPRSDVGKIDEELRSRARSNADQPC